jgi:threonine synthase
MAEPRLRIISTRGLAEPGSTAPSDAGVSFSVALARGLAPDGGLYLPDRLPRIPASVLAMLEEAAAADAGSPRALAATAQAIVEPFLAHPDDAHLREALPELCRQAFSAPIPLRRLDAASGLLELFHGPTAAFKDFGARFLAGALALEGAELEGAEKEGAENGTKHDRRRERGQEDRGEPRLPGTPHRGHVLVATSGDTGSAVGAAFEGRPGFRVSILFPERGVSERQAHLLSCFGGDDGNVASYRVAGTFDDAQKMVKAALADPARVRAHHLTSANSISLGRLLPQATWFAHAALAWRHASGEAPGFIVPSGNFGHGLAALWARAMGFPVGPVHLATNRNRALVDWVERGEVAPRTSVRTPASAMDVGVPSNLERLRFQVRQVPDLAKDLEATAVGDAGILEAVGRAPGRWGVVACPHTACGLHVLEDRRARGDTRGWIVTATAHPAKFPEVVEPRIGRPVPLPPALSLLLERPARSRRLEADPAALIRVLDGEPSPEGDPRLEGEKRKGANP